MCHGSCVVHVAQRIQALTLCVQAGLRVSLSPRLGGLVVALILAAAALAATPAAAQTPPGPFADPPVTIRSSGPLTSIFTGRRFQCQVSYENEGQYFPPDAQFGDCGTYITLGGEPGGTLYGQPFGTRIPNLPPVTPSLAWSQPGVTGNGTAAAPFTNKTTNRVPNTDVYVRENVRYVTGENFYRSDIIVQNSGSEPVTFRLYHVVDCHPVTGGTFGLGYGVQRDDGAGLTSIGCSAEPEQHARRLGAVAGAADRPQRLPARLLREYVGSSGQHALAHELRLHGHAMGRGDGALVG